MVKLLIKKQPYKPKKRDIAIFLILISFIILFVYTISSPDYLVKSMTRFLIERDNKQVSDVIVVLGGWELDKRIEHGIDLYKQGYGRKILLSGGGTEEETREIFLESGVPDSDVIIEDKSTDTYENAVFTEEIVQKNKFKSLIIVASPDQSKRAKYIFNKAFRGSEIFIFSSPAKGTTFTPDQIMKSKEAKEQLVLESVKFIYYFFKYLFV